MPFTGCSCLGNDEHLCAEEMSLITTLFHKSFFNEMRQYCGKIDIPTILETVKLFLITLCVHLPPALVMKQYKIFLDKTT